MTVRLKSKWHPHPLLALSLLVGCAHSSFSHSQALPEEVRATLMRIQQAYEKEMPPEAQEVSEAPTTEEPPVQEDLPPPGPAISQETQRDNMVGLPEPEPEPASVVVEAAPPNREQPSAEPGTESSYDSRFAIGEELIFTLELGELTLGDVFAIRSEFGYQIGLLEFAQLVDFAIDVDIDEGSASGWFIEQGSTFTLAETESGSLAVTAGNRQFTITPDRYQISDDIFVELADIEKWFAVTTSINEAQLVIHLASAKPFPIEQRLARQRKRFEGSTAFSRSVLPVKENGYRLLTAPLLDVQVSTQQTDTDTSAAYSILSSQDAAYFSSQLFLSGNDNDALQDARLTLSRRSNDADLLGPLNMTEYSFGDVTPVNIGVGDTQSLGRGFRMSNARYGLVDNRRVNLVGEIQVGWDIELYRNGVLIDSRTAVAEGRYEFNDVELGFGQNDFELVFYGPQGQIERREESYYVDSNVAEEGEGLVQFSVVDANKTLFGVSDYTEDASLLGPLVSLSYDYGITDWLSVGVGASHFSPDEGDATDQVALRSNFVLGDFGLLNSIFQFDDNDRRAMLHAYRTQVGNTNFDITYRRDEILDDEILDALGATRSASDNISVRMSGTLFSRSSLPVSYQNLWARSEFFSGNTTETFQNSLGINSRWGSLSHGLLWQKQTFAEQNLNDGDAVSDDSLYGSLGYRNRFGRVFTRIFAEYQIQPDTEFSAVGTSLNYPFTNTLTSELRYTYDVISHQDRYDMRLNWLGEKISLTGIANYAASDDWSINLIARFGLGYDSGTDTFFMSGRPLAQSGAVVLRMFEDENLDGQYNEGESTLNNVEVRATQAFREEKTNESGLAVLKSLPPDRSTDIVVDESTFSDPSMTVASEGFAVASRRGIVQQFDIPVVRAGELEGTLYWRNESGEEQIAPYVRMNLVNPKGEIVATTRTEFDGYYLFTKVMPGNYSIAVDTTTGRQRDMTPERFKEITVSNRGDLITGIDMVLRELVSAEGYMVSAGEFSSLAMLKLYVKLLSRRLDEKWLSDAFYYVAPNGKHVLGLKYSEGLPPAPPQSMTTFCGQLTSLEVTCKVETVKFNY